MASVPDPVAIKRLAAARAQEKRLPYAGALTPAEAYALTQAGAKLVDVRTKPEMQYVGKVPGSLAVEWQTWPGSQPNPEFLSQLAQLAKPEDTVLFICRSGSRSHDAAAAAAQAGYRDSYNVLEGFEGNKDAAQHRGNINGWRKAGLPWTQS